METYISSDHFTPFMQKLLAVTVLLIVLWLVIRTGKKQISKRITDTDRQYRIRKLLNFAGYILVVVIIAASFSQKLESIGLTLGLASAGVAFALQEVIASFAGWITLLFGNFYKPGDRIQINGIQGDVIDIGILRTTLMETGAAGNGEFYNGRIVFVSNRYVLTEVFNFSGDFPFVWDEIKVPIRFDSDHDLVRVILEDVANEVTEKDVVAARADWEDMSTKFRLDDVPITPLVTLVATDNWVEYTVRYLVGYKSKRLIKDRLFTSILQKFNETKGSIQFASATFEVVGMPEMRIETQESKSNGINF